MRHAAAVRRFANPRIVPRSGRFDRPNPIVGGWFALVIGAILVSATGTCCASGGASWLEVEAPPSLPNRCLHLAQMAGAGLSFDGELSYKPVSSA